MSFGFAYTITDDDWSRAGMNEPTVIEYDASDYTEFDRNADTWRWYEGGKLVKEVKMGDASALTPIPGCDLQPATLDHPQPNAFDLPSRERLAEYFRKQRAILP